MKAEWLSRNPLYVLIIIAVPAYVAMTYFGLVWAPWRWGPGPAPHPSTPAWVLDLTDDNEMMARTEWHPGHMIECRKPFIRAMQRGHLRPNLTPPDLNNITVTLGLHVQSFDDDQNDLICTLDSEDATRPSCIALHELAHAIDTSNSWTTRHDEDFYRIYRDLVQRAGPDVHGLKTAASMTPGVPHRYCP